MKNRQTSYFLLPSNVRKFSPKIMGLNAKKAVMIVASLSIAGLLLQFSILYSFLAVSGVILFGLPPGSDEIAVSRLASVIIWKFARPRKGNPVKAKIREEEGIQFLSEQGRKGCCISIEPLSFHALSEDRKDLLVRSLSQAISPLPVSLTFLALPAEADPERYYKFAAGRMADDYNMLLDYVFKDSYYYRPYVVVWSRSAGWPESSGRLISYAQQLKDALMQALGECRIITEHEEMQQIAEGMLTGQR